MRSVWCPLNTSLYNTGGTSIRHRELEDDDQPHGAATRSGSVGQVGGYETRACVSCRTRVSVLIYESMDRPGGIPSIVLREMALARSRKDTVFVVCRGSTPLSDVPATIRLDFHDSPKRWLDRIVSQVAGETRKLDIVAFSPEAAPVGFLLQGLAMANPVFESASLSLTVLHPRDLMRETESRHVHLLNRFLAHAIGLQNLVFMNEQCRATHSTFLGLDLSANSIVPAPIDERVPRWKCSSNSGRLRIVSVGRIVKFKAYNFAFPSILAKLVAEGRDVTCDIFGYGREEPRLAELVRVHGVSDRLRFHGAIALNQFDEIVSEYDLFVGMGTAALQAAQLGVPTILALVDDEHGAHGFIDSAPFGNLGEQDKSADRHDLKKLIEWYLGASTEERKQLSLAGIRYANRYVVDDYVERLTKESVPRKGVSRQVASLYCRFYLWMTKDNWLRRCVQVAKRVQKKVYPK